MQNLILRNLINALNRRRKSHRSQPNFKINAEPSVDARQRTNKCLNRRRKSHRSQPNFKILSLIILTATVDFDKKTPNNSWYDTVLVEYLVSLSRWPRVPKVSLFYYDTLDGGRTFSRPLRLSLHAGRTYAKVMVQKINLTLSSSTPKFFPACLLFEANRSNCGQATSTTATRRVRGRGVSGPVRTWSL